MYQAGLKDTVSQEFKRMKTVWLKCQIIKISRKQILYSFYADLEPNIWIYDSE
jgi:hypothetical protein